MPDKYSLFQKIATLLPVALVMCVLVFSYLNPSFVYGLAYEDGPIEYMSALFLLLASIIMLTLVGQFAKRKLWLGLAASLLITTITFIMCMEEISWGQRIFNTSSPDFFQNKNMQQETNIHNLNTFLFQAIFYAGAFVLLTLLPFYYKNAKKVLEKINLQKLIVFLPATWLFTPFVVVSGLTFVNGYLQNITASIIAVITFILSIVMLYRLLFKKSFIKQGAVLALAILTSSVLLITVNTLDFGHIGIPVWYVSEYKEAFISLGILFYTISVYTAAHKSIAKSLD